MHNSSGCATSNAIKNGDTWLAQAVPAIFASNAYKNGGTLFITWDEAASGDGPIGMIVLSPNAKVGYSNTLHYTHSSTLRTIQEIFGVRPLLGDAAQATTLSNLFSSTASWGSGTTATATPSPTFAASRTSTPTPTATRTPTAMPSSLVLSAVADTYVDSSSPSSNYGNSTTLRTDASPIINSYLRFNVQGISGTVTNATLRVYANSSSSGGLSSRGVVNTTWSETSTTYGNAPAVGSIVSSSSGFSAGSWVSLNVTALVRGNGLVSFALTSTNSTAVSFSSRQGAKPPQLLITVTS
jgi:hypothetical protein